MALARDRILLTADVVTAASTNYTPVTGLSFAAVVGRRYHFRIVAMFTVAATTTGVRFGLSANPTTAPTYLGYFGIGASAVGTLGGGSDNNATARYVTTGATTGGYTALTDSANTGAGNLHVVEGILVPAATAVVQVEVGPEAAAAVTVIKGSYVEWEAVG